MDIGARTFDLDRYRRGRLDVATIIGRYKSEDDLTAMGNLIDIPSVSVKVNRGLPYIGRKCLVRIHEFFADREPRASASFISSAVPDDFKSLGPKGYVLLGHINEQMARTIKQNGTPPNLEKIRRTETIAPFGLADVMRYYNPGHLEMAVYLDSFAWCGQYSTIRKNPPVFEVFEDGIEEAIRRLINADGTPLAIYRKEIHLQRLEKIIRSNGMVPVRMEPFFSEAPLTQTF